ncbi:hypothetical protein [Halococcus saccharolyticus]|uniref:Uncharacterized protein n=1 Tax=Halococcus saccharolyticus DSM 5350 TaxID=1227455 RepID=M0MS89_9EURY|nr:hypothetical protein [Halococcus saccharolyticus]EMA47604.1 hypothetical protein C449_01037 [Halococcus saccharolyticus DSM 5350]
MTRTTISVSEETKAALAEEKGDETWDEFLRTRLADAPEPNDTVTADLSDGAVEDIRTAVDRGIDSLRSDLR